MLPNVANRQLATDLRGRVDDGEISWWLLVSLLTDGSNTAAKDLTRQLMAAWEMGGESVQDSHLPTLFDCSQHRAVPG